MERIFIAEDDRTILEELSTLLRNHGYLPVYEPPCDLALLDVNLSDGESGFELCRKLKASCGVPVVFLTARDGAEDELLGFGVGADDYIKKPYNSAVLLARIARLLKKSDEGISVRELLLDEKSFTLYFRDKSTPLTKNETRILRCLMHRELCSREELIEQLWADGCYLDENALYVNINRLREKLKSLGADGYLQTFRGVGYKL